MLSYKYIRVVIFGATILLFFIILINYIINPYAIFNPSTEKYFRLNKTVFESHTRMGKAYVVREMKPKTIILGASRTEMGLNPEHAGFQYQPVYNLSLASANVYEVYRYFQHTSNQTKLFQVILTVDFFQFNANKPSTPDFLESRLSISYKGEQINYPLQEALSALASVDGLVASIETLIKSSNGKPILFDNGQKNDQFTKNNIKKQGGYHKAFLLNEEDYIRYIYFPYPKQRFDFYSSDTGFDSFLIFQDLIGECYSKGIDLKIIISPSHARQWEALASIGLWNKWEFWKRELVRINKEVAVKYEKKIFPLWDFSGYNVYTVEIVPELEDKVTEMQWYLESSHYNNKLGELVLDRVFNYRHPKRQVAEGFGVLIDSKNIDRHLLKIQKERENYRLTHASDIKEIEELAKKYK